VIRFICSFFSLEFFSLNWSMSSSFSFILSVDSLSLRRFVFELSSSFVFELFSISFFAESIFEFAVVEMLCLWFSPTVCLQIGQNLSLVISSFNFSSLLMFISKMAFLFSFSRVSFSEFDICSIVVSILFLVSVFRFSFSLVDFEYLISWNSDVIVCSMSCISFEDSIRNFSFWDFWFSVVARSDLRM